MFEEEVGPLWLEKEGMHFGRLFRDEGEHDFADISRQCVVDFPFKIAKQGVNKGFSILLYNFFFLGFFSTFGLEVLNNFLEHLIVLIFLHIFDHLLLEDEGFGGQEHIEDKGDITTQNLAGHIGESSCWHGYLNDRF